ncbi:hypothetical protein E1301_Tti006312 [Triplophysa tibetana]|uniref:Uncharacterized protein n=1 Tax=Triplophysa tibetana TaxID=1572043 RepID=A0A5A9NT33_9TELE|nr:hypothetical protein E1301_Tti006312 [Triplophysa tibetana]
MKSTPPPSASAAPSNPFADLVNTSRQQLLTSLTSTLPPITNLYSGGWNESALVAVFRQGLNTPVHSQMAIYDDDEGLEKLIQRYVHIAQPLTVCDYR